VGTTLLLYGLGKGAGAPPRFPASLLVRRGEPTPLEILPAIHTIFDVAASANASPVRTRSENAVAKGATDSIDTSKKVLIMSTNTMLPVLAHPWINAAGEALPVQSGPGLKPSAIDSLRTSFPGTLTPEFEQLLTLSCGLDGTALQYIDFTGQWHREEPLAVFRPCLTLAIDGEGRRWIAETANTRGLPGPVWCVMQDPEVVVYVSADLGEFLKLLHRTTCDQSIDGWLKAVDTAAERAWRQRGALAFYSRQECGHDRDVRQWLLQLPRDARVYDLRSPKFGVAWPYGAAGNTGRFHRCGRECLFAVSGFPAPSRWADYLGNLAHHHEAPVPAIMANQRVELRQAPQPPVPAYAA